MADNKDQEISRGGSHPTDDPSTTEEVLDNPPADDQVDYFEFDDEEEENED